VLAWQKTTKLVSKQMSAFALGTAGGMLGTPEFCMQSRPLKFRVAPFDLSLVIAESDEDYGAAIEYSRDAFDAATAGRMLSHLKSLLEAAIRDPQRRISDIPLLDEPERNRMLIEWNRTEEEYPAALSIHEWFEEQVARAPDRTAVTFGEERLTYSELNRRANRLAHLLKRAGVGPEVLAGICLERSTEMIVALLAVLKAGGAYVPLDPAYPPQRLNAIVEEAAPPVLVTTRELAARFAFPCAHVIALDGESGRIATESDSNPVSSARPQNLAYVIFTSGSTGRPKGVLLQHLGLVNLVRAQTRGFGMKPESRVLQFASFSFDASVSEIFMALVTGAALHLARPEVLFNGPELLRLMREEGITAVTLPPSLLSVLPAVDLPKLKILISAGEACSWDIAARWAPGRRFFNAYGPTETTIGPAYFEVGSIRRELAGVPIGRPIANTRFYVLDCRMQPVPAGVAGELHVGGVGLAHGYLGRPDLTADRFIPDPFSAKPGARLYRTGDLVRYLSDGNLEYLGRIDQQVKVRGFRVELSEIEAVLERHPNVREAVVVCCRDGRPDSYLAAYVVPGDRKPGLDDLRAHLREYLPDYMTPSRFVVLDKLPLTSNGKVDRKALPDPAAIGIQREGGFEAPGTEIERTIAAVWAEVLGVPEVGTNDNFFDLGGHSLALARVHAALEERFSRSLPMTELFRFPTVKALASFLSKPQEAGASTDARERAALQRQALERQRQRHAPAGRR
jgi:amino acid adenylation domain-containing protein